MTRAFKLVVSSKKGFYLFLYQCVQTYYAESLNLRLLSFTTHTILRPPESASWGDRLSW